MNRSRWISLLVALAAVGLGYWALLASAKPSSPTGPVPAAVPAAEQPAPRNLTSSDDDLVA